MPASPEDLFKLFGELGIVHTDRGPPPVYTVDDAKALRGEIPGGHCKNLFLKDKKAQLWLVVCLEDTAVDMKSLPAIIGAARVSFGKPELLKEVLGVGPGSVTPFALINDHEQRVNVILEEQMMQCELVSFHPLTNSATTTLTPADLMKFIRHCGHEPQIIGLSA